MNANERHAEIGYRTLLVHAQRVNIESSANHMEEIAVDLLTSLLHLSGDYNFNLDDMLRAAKDRFEAEKIEASSSTNSAVSLQDVINELVGEVEQHPSGFSSESDVKVALQNIAADASLANLTVLVEVVRRYAMSDDIEMTEPVNKAKRLLVESSLAA